MIRKKICYLVAFNLLLSNLAGCSFTREEEVDSEVVTEASEESAMEEAPSMEGESSAKGEPSKEGAPSMEGESSEEEAPEEVVLQREYAPEDTILLSKVNSYMNFGESVLLDTYKGGKDVLEQYQSLTYETEITVQEIKNPYQKKVSYESFGKDFGLALEVDKEQANRIKNATDSLELTEYYQEIVEEFSFPFVFSILSSSLIGKMEMTDNPDAAKEELESLTPKEEKKLVQSLVKDYLTENDLEDTKENRQGAESLFQYLFNFLKVASGMEEDQQDLTKEFFRSIDEKNYDILIGFFVKNAMEGKDLETLKEGLPTPIKKAYIVRLEDNSIVTKEELETFYQEKEKELYEEALREAKELEELLKLRQTEIDSEKVESL